MNHISIIKLDLINCRHPMSIVENDVWKTTCETRHRVDEWLIMLFDLCDAPIALMKMMNGVFLCFLDKFVIVNLDDMITFSSSWEVRSFEGAD